MKHLCHAVGCTVEVPPKLLMCKAHWYMVPGDLRRRVWATYVKGQEIRKDPSPDYFDAAQAAIDAVRDIEERSST